MNTDATAVRHALDQDWLMTLLVEFSDSKQISEALVLLCRRSFSIACSHPAVFQIPMADWLSSIFGTLDRHDKKLKEEAEKIELLAQDAVHRPIRLHSAGADGQVRSTGGDVNEVVDAMWKALDAAGSHADTCAAATKTMVKRAGTFSSCLRWLKTVGVPCTSAKDLVDVQRKELIDREIAEFRQRMALLCAAAESLSSAMSIRGGLVARNERLSHAARSARLAGVPEADLEEFQQQCTGVHEIWGDNSKKFHAIEVSMHMRALAFLDLTESDEQASSASLSKPRLPQADGATHKGVGTAGLNLLAAPCTGHHSGSVVAALPVTPVLANSVTRSSASSRSGTDFSSSSMPNDDTCSARPERGASRLAGASASPGSSPQSSTGPWRFTVSLLDMPR